MDTPRTRTRRSFICKEPGCGRSFLRQEHLQRHHLNHQPGEIFSCDICPKSFVRQDLYRRHKSRHAKGMFFRNTGGVIHPASTTSASSDPAQFPHLQVMQAENTCGDLSEETLAPEKNVPFQNKDNDLGSSFWSGCALDVPSVQDGLDWFFGEPLQGISELVDSPMPPQLDPDLSIHLQPLAPCNSDSQAIIHSTEGVEELNLLLDVNTDQENDWSIALSGILASLSQLDIRILQSPFFEVGNLRMFYDLYFKHYHPQFPIIHQATISVTTCHPLLLIAILDLGSTMVTDETLFDLGQQVHHSLRLIILNSGIFECPIALWCLQALLLVQAYGKMISSRKNYEMAHIFHGTILTMMKRGSVYLTASTSQPPDSNEPSQLSWHRWINEECWRRTACFAFVMDAQHACVFGHSPVLSVIDMRIMLPCLEPLWECSSAETWQVLNRTEKSASLFLPTLKSLLREKVLPPHCSEYARFVLLHGLMSLQTHLQAGSRFTLGIDMDRLDAHANTRHPTASSSSSTPVWANTIDTAFNTWSTCLFSLQPSLCLEAARPIYRIAQITLHVSVIDIHTLAMDPVFLSSPFFPHVDPAISFANANTSTNNITASKALTRLQRWVHTDSARSACRYALLLIQETMFSGKHYLAREDNVAPRPWCLYIAVLTLWVYGVVTEGPGPASDGDTVNSAEEYMIRMTRAMQEATPANPIIRGANRIVGLIRAVRDALAWCRWELLQEAHLVLRRLGGEIVLDAGGDRKTLI